MNEKKYFQPLIDKFKLYSDEDNSFAMAKYMKNKFRFFGIKSPLRKELTKNFYKEIGLPDKAEISKYILYLWEKPEREQQYVAMELLSKYIKKADADIINLLETLIINKSWWDTVDFIASNLCGDFLKIYPELKSEYIPKWLNSNNIWLNRSTLLFQLKYKKETDVELLFSLILKLSESKEFFIQKAIGWSLRQYSKTNPEIVRQFIETNQLAPLSVREGLKIINKK